MRLTELDAQLIWKRDEDGSFWSDCKELSKAQGIMFLCPLCFKNNGGSRGTHHVICWFKDRGVPDDASPGPGRWNPSGKGIDDLTFVPPGNVSVFLNGEGGCQWHGFVKNGDAE